MSATATLQLNLSIFDGNTTALADTIEFADAGINVSYQRAFAFATGDNTLTKPTGATTLVIWGISGTLKLYSSSNPALPTTNAVVVLPVGETTVVINAGAGAASNLAWV